MPKKNARAAVQQWAKLKAAASDSEEEEDDENSDDEEEIDEDDEDEDEGGENVAGEAAWAQGRVRAYHKRDSGQMVQLKVTVPTTQKACEDLRGALGKDFLEVTFQKGASASAISKLLYQECKRRKPRSLPPSTSMHLVGTREKHGKRNIGLGPSADIALLREWHFDSNHLVCPFF